MDVENYIKHRDQLIQKGVDQFKVCTIGQHVVDIIKRDGEISVISLIESLKRGLAAPVDEKDRILTEAALALLQGFSSRQG